MKFIISSISSIDFYNLLLCALGIRTKLLDFRRKLCKWKNNNDSVTVTVTTATTTIHPINNSLNQILKCIPFAIGFAFAYIYPKETLSIVSRIPFAKNGKKSVDYFIGCAYFYLKYIVTILIYLMQFRNERFVFIQQSEIMVIFQRLWSLNEIVCRTKCTISKTKNLALNMLHHLNNHRHSITLATMNVFTDLHLLQIFTVIIVRTIASYFEYNHVCQHITQNNCKIKHSYHVIWFFFPNIFIDLFVWQLSITLHQYIKLFELLNQIFDTVGIDMRHRMLLHDLYKFGGTIKKRHFHTNQRHIETLIDMHQQLTTNTHHFQQLNTIQVNACILNAFANIIMEVRNEIMYIELVNILFYFYFNCSFFEVVHFVECGLGFFFFFIKAFHSFIH